MNYAYIVHLKMKMAENSISYKPLKGDKTIMIFHYVKRIGGPEVSPLTSQPTQSYCESPGGVGVRLGKRWDRDDRSAR